MTEPAFPSWLNKGKNALPDWLTPHVVGRRDANGTFLIRTKAGREGVQARVLVGYIVIDRNGVAYTRHPSEARGLLTELDEEEQVFAPLGPKQPGAGRPAARGALAKGNQSAVAEISQPHAVRSPKEINPSKPRRKPARGAMPSIEWVQLDRLQVDDSYQRSIDTRPSAALIKRIGDEWDWRLCVPLMVSRRLEGLYVIDGQHRLQGARLRNDVPQLPCCISVYDGPADEAAMFVAANRERRAMNRLDDFHAAQAGGDADALAVAAIVESVGFTVSRRTGSAAWVPGEVAFTSAIGTMRRKHGESVCRAALQAMADAFPGQRLVAGSSVFTATARILVNPPPAFDRDRLFRALRTFDMPGWADFLTKAKGGDERAQRLRDMLLAAYDDLAKGESA